MAKENIIDTASKASTVQIEPVKVEPITSEAWASMPISYLDKPKPFKRKKGKKDVPLFCQKDLLSILGTAESLPAAPYENEDFEIWAVAVCSTYPSCKRIDVQFELHTDGYWQDKNVLARLKKTIVPIYMHEHHKEIPMSIRYPIELITEPVLKSKINPLLTIQNARYHTNSISYMLALALLSYLETGKPKYVAMFGIHMAAREEYTDQRPCCEYWTGVMRGVGMNVDPSPGGAILSNGGLYGYENYHPVCHAYRQRIQGLQMGYQQAKLEHDKWEHQMWKQEGAITEDEWFLRQHQRGEVPK